MDDEDCNIRVICRFRPVNKREIAEGGGIAKQLTFPTDKCVEVAPFNGRSANTFNFDKVFYDPSTTQQDVYELAAKQSIEDVLKGYNSTIFAYGQTGAGKSFTMFGPDIAADELKGIIPRACMHIFEHIASDTEGTEYTIKCSFLEIYKEIVRDLLNPARVGAKGLRVREAPDRGVWVEGLHEAYVTCEQDVLDLLKTGEKHRATSSTNMNATSSRSHSLFILTLHQKTRDGSTKEGKLNLADLAGSEKVGKTGATGDTLEEAKKINQSLSALGNCIKALTKAKRAHVPYRDSKLTHILRESLGGNCKSTLLVAASPHIFNLEETVSTLMFAKRAKTIKNNVKVNKQRSVEELMGIIEKLKREMIFLKKYVTILEQELEKVKGPNWKDDLPKVARPQPKKAPKKKETISEESSAKPSSEKDNNKAEPDDDDDEEQTENSEQQSEREEDEDEKVYSNSAEMSVKLAGLQVELQKVKEKAELDVKDLQEEVKSLTNDNESAEKNLQIKNEKIRQYETDIKNLKDELETSQQAKALSEEKLEYEIKRLTLKDEEQQENLSEVTSHNSELKEKTVTLGQQLEEMITEKDRFARDYEKAQQENEEMKDQISRKKEQIENIEQSLAHFETTYQTIRDQNLQLEANNKELKEKYESLDEKYSSLFTQSKENDSKLRIANNTQNFLENQIQDLKSDIESLENELQEAKEQVNKAHEVKDAVQEAGKEKIEELLTKTVPLSDYERIMKDKEKYRNSVSELKTKLTEEKSSVASLKSEMEEKISSLSTEKEQMEEKLNSELSEKHKQIQLLEAKLNELAESKEKKLAKQKSKLDDLLSDFESEKLARQKLQEKLDAQYDINETNEKSVRKLTSEIEDLSRENKQQGAIIQSQTRSLEAQTERIKRLEVELDECTKDREILQQEIKTALEINIENAKQFEKQLDVVREEEEKRVIQKRPKNIRVPVNQPDNGGFFASIFGIKQYPVLGSLSNPIKFGYMLKRSNWLKKWEKRWFVLLPDTMYYFESNNQAIRASGEIELDHVRVVPAGEFTGKPNSLGLIHRTRKEFYLQAASEDESIDWMRCISMVSKNVTNTKKLHLPKTSQSAQTVVQPNKVNMST